MRSRAIETALTNFCLPHTPSLHLLIDHLFSPPSFHVRFSGNSEGRSSRFDVIQPLTDPGAEAACSVLSFDQLSNCRLDAADRRHHYEWEGATTSSLEQQQRARQVPAYPGTLYEVNIAVTSHPWKTRVVCAMLCAMWGVMISFLAHRQDAASCLATTASPISLPDRHIQPCCAAACQAATPAIQAH